MSKTVLTVDDSPSIRQMIKVTLEPAGHNVIEAGDGAQGLAKAQAGRPDLVITDLNMPVMNGMELIRALRKQPSLTGLPIVFLTGHGDVPKTVRAMKAGAVDFLTKPVDAPVLLDAVARAIARDAENRVVRARQHEARARYGRLTPRERDVFAHLISGQLNKQIGYDLGISERTTKIHRHQVLEKMQADSIADLVRTAADLGIAPVGKVR